VEPGKRLREKKGAEKPEIIYGQGFLILNGANGNSNDSNGEAMGAKSKPRASELYLAKINSAIRPDLDPISSFSG